MQSPAVLDLPCPLLTWLLRLLLQALLGWIAGCAWTDVVGDVFPPQRWDPDDDAHGSVVIVYNLLGALLLTGLSVAYLLYNVDPDGVHDATSRADVERSFLTGALTFFVGWQWNVVHRNITSVVYLTEWGSTALDALLSEDPDRAGAMVTALTVTSITAAFFAVKHRLVTGKWSGADEADAEGAGVTGAHGGAYKQLTDKQLSA